MIKCGIKIWSSNYELFDKALLKYQEQLFDFIELYIVPDSCEQEKLSKLKKIPIIAHAPHQVHGLNLCLDEKMNQQLIAKTQKIADFFPANIIIIHPGAQGSLIKAKNNLRKIKDQRFVLENMPKQELPRLGGGVCLGATYKEIKQLLCLGFSLCLDFSHAIKSSISQKIPYKKFIIRLITDFSPAYFHLSDGKLDNPYDEHLNLGEGQFDLKWIKRKLEKLASNQDIYLVFETPKKGHDLENDIKNIRYFENI